MDWTHAVAFLAGSVTFAVVEALINGGGSWQDRPPPTGPRPVVRPKK